MKNAVELIEALRYNICMFGVPIDGPTNIFCDNEAVTKNISDLTLMLKKKHHSIAYHRNREAVAAGTVASLRRIRTQTQVIYSQSC